MRGQRSHINHSYLLFIVLLTLAACSPQNAQSGAPTPGPGIISATAVPAGSGNPSQAAPTLAPNTEPTEPSSFPPVTLADDGRTLNMRVGQTFLLNLGEGYTWQVSVDDTNVLSRKVNVLVIKGAQGIYQANSPGTAKITASGDPLCRQSTPPCMAPSREFHIQVVVN